jgi:hypothetical protein
MEDGGDGGLARGGETGERDRRPPVGGERERSRGVGDFNRCAKESGEEIAPLLR